MVRAWHLSVQMDAPPRLIETVGEHNIVTWRGRSREHTTGKPLTDRDPPMLKTATERICHAQ